MERYLQALHRDGAGGKHEVREADGMDGVRIGISGWTYAGWRGVFYPKGLAHRCELEFASTQLSSIEINGTFYSLQSPRSFEKWHEETPDNFVFAVKGSRFITHMKQLRDIEIPLANFFASGILALGKKLGPILWQFAPRTRFDADKFRGFLQLLPRTTAEAAALAGWHDERLIGRSFIDPGDDRPLRHALEVRHPSFMVPQFTELLAEHDAALVFSDSAGTWPYFEDATTDFIYIRLHGAEELYASGYTAPALEHWADRIRTWHLGQEPADAVRVGRPAPQLMRPRAVYVYFDNDRKVHAPFDAMRLAQRLATVEQRLAS
jgi:uncharacterized protein YecE (DUF72 family)